MSRWVIGGVLIVAGAFVILIVRTDGMKRYRAWQRGNAEQMDMAWMNRLFPERVAVIVLKVIGIALVGVGALVLAGVIETS